MVSGSTLACLPASAEIDEICERTCTGSPELGFGLCFAGVSCVTLGQSIYSIWILQIPYFKKTVITSSSLLHRVLVRLK